MFISAPHLQTYVSAKLLTTTPFTSPSITLSPPPFSGTTEVVPQLAHGRGVGVGAGVVTPSPETQRRMFGVRHFSANKLFFLFFFGGGGDLSRKER